MWPYRSSLVNTFIGPFFFHAPENPSAGSSAASPAGFCAAGDGSGGSEASQMSA